jgi:hypothetical protein
MPILLSTSDLQDLATRLSKMRLWRAKWTAYGLDKSSTYDMWRVAVGTDEYHTRISLPTKGIQVTFIEKREQKGSPSDFGYVKVKYNYVEARVAMLPKPTPEPETPEYLRFT